tara:strand:- start:7770 stop:7976 length:207 start_codon:yes stop_codon:yes gene_type:complete
LILIHWFWQKNVHPKYNGKTGSITELQVYFLIFTEKKVFKFWLFRLKNGFIGIINDKNGKTGKKPCAN